ncbi:octopamine receptor beta-2R-like [Antedon mediterranea]|uniref:octopamine receptor beta-2R-like n=1 Tax=Antedon mediterranea TaxID=105859 RepID=UPI003AF5E0C8
MFNNSTLADFTVMFTFGISLTWILTIITILGNTLVIYSFFRDKSIRSKPANVFIFVLAVADFIVGIISLPFYNILVLYDSWMFGEIVCKCMLFCDYSACAISSCCIVLLSLDRYWMVTKHLLYKHFMTHCKARVLSAVVVIFCITFYGTTIFFWELISTNPLQDDSNCSLPVGEPFNTVMCSTVYAVTMFVLTYLNITVFVAVVNWSNGNSLKRDINKQKSKTSNSILSENTTSPSTISVKPADSNLAIRRFRAQNNQETKKAAMMLGVLVVAFLICWTPFNIVHICINIGVFQVNSFTWDVVNYMLWFNSGLNPILYALTNRQFRKNFVDMFLCRQC